MSDIRVGIIGAGGNTRTMHIPGLQKIDGVEIVGVVNRSTESSQRVADEFGIPKVYDHWTDAIDDPDTDAIVVGTWPYLHCAATIAALDAGKHVMCEARMAMNAAEAHQMRDTAQVNPALVAQIVPSPMTLAVDKTVVSMISEGRLGDILAVEIRNGGSFLDMNGGFHWRMDTDLSGLNIMSLGIWYEAIMRWIGEAKSVMASGKTFVTMRKDDSGVARACSVPEHIDVLAKMVCGAQTHIQISSASGLLADNSVYIFGRDGTLKLEGETLYFCKRGDDKLEEIIITDALKGGWRVEEEFVAAIRGEEVITHTTFDDGVKYMEFTEAVNISMAEGQAVNLPLS